MQNMASDSRRLEGPFLFVFADAGKAPLIKMLPLVDRWNVIREFVGARRAPHMTGHVVPDEDVYLWVLENDDPDAAMLPLNPWMIDRMRGNVVLCSANYERLSTPHMRWAKQKLLRAP